MEQVTCSVEDCGKPSYARGLCRNCYRRAWYNGTVGEAPEVRPRHRVSDVNEGARTGVCVICGPVKVRYKASRNYYECAARTKQYREKRTAEERRRDRLKGKYGLTVTQYDEMYATIDGSCEICQEPLPLLQVDHDHDSGEVRGLLCPPCNKGLGQFKDSPSILASALDYLSRTKKTIGVTS